MEFAQFVFVGHLDKVPYKAIYFTLTLLIPFLRRRQNTPTICFGF